MRAAKNRCSQIEGGRNLARWSEERRYGGEKALPKHAAELGDRDGQQDDNNATTMTKTKAAATLALVFLLASAAGTPTFAAETVEVKTNDALAELAQNMISTDGVLENITMHISGDVTDLTPLSGLKHIKGGGLEIFGTTKLVSLAPLENLEVVDRYFVIEGNEAVTDISLPALTEIDGELRLYSNNVLASGKYQPSHTAPLFPSHSALSLTRLYLFALLCYSLLAQARFSWLLCFNIQKSNSHVYCWLSCCFSWGLLYHRGGCDDQQCAG